MDKDIAAYQAWAASQGGGGQSYIKNFVKKAPAAAAPKKPISSGLGSMIGGTLGGIGGGLLGTAIAPGVGTVAGGVSGGAAGSALGEALDQILTGGRIKNVGQIAGEATLGAAPGLLGTGMKAVKAGRAGLKLGAYLTEEAAAKAAEKAAVKAGAQTAGKYTLQGKLGAKANDILASQYGTISKPVARQTRLPETIGILAQRGITKPADAERIGRAFTGGDGIVSKAVTRAIGNKSKIQATDLAQIADELSTKNMLLEPQIKALNKYVAAAAGKLSSGTSADAMDVVRRLESKVADLTGKGGNYHLPTGDDVALSKVLGGIADTLKDRVYSKANIKAVLTPKLRDELISLHPGNKKWIGFIDKEVMGAKDIGALRKAQSAFVRIGKAIDEGDVNSMTAGGRIGNSLAGGALGQALNAIAGTQAAKRVAAGTLKTAGNVVGSDIAGNTVKGGMAFAGQGGARAALAPFTGGMASRGMFAANGQADPQQDPLTLESAMMGAQGFGQPQGFGDMQDPTSQDANDPFSADNMKMLALHDIQTTGGKNLAKIAQLQALFGSKDKPIKLTEAQNARQEALGLTNDALDMLQSGAVKTGMLNTPIEEMKAKFGMADQATLEFNTTTSAIRAAIAKARAGTSMTPGEERMLNRYTPAPGDSKQQLQVKLLGLKRFLGQGTQRDMQMGGGIDPSMYVDTSAQYQ